jgi:hypothetical protein
MKKQQYILLIGLLIVTLNTWSQKLIIQPTCDLIKISENYGLDSALTRTNRLPIDYIDSLTAVTLIGNIAKSEPTYQTTKFLANYSLKHEYSELTNIIFEYYSLCKSQIVNFKVEDFSGLPVMSDDEILAILKYSDNRTENLLIDLYKQWNEKSLQYIEDYTNGPKENYPGWQQRLMQPYIDCNENCAKILSSLKKINSSFYDSTKFDSHAKYLEEHKRNHTFYYSGESTNYNVIIPTHTILLAQHYKSLCDIDYTKSEFKRIFKGFTKNDCWKFLLCNDLIGYLDLGCQFAEEDGFGVLMRIELKGEKLLIFEIERWIS